MATLAFAFVVLRAESTGADASQEPTADAAQRAVLALDARRAQAFVDGDADFLDRITAADYTHVETSGVARDKAEFIAERRSGKLRFRSFNIEVNEARVFGDVAVVTGHYSNQVETAAGLQPVKRARHQRVYVRRNGEWLVVAHQATEIATPPGDAGQGSR